MTNARYPDRIAPAGSTCVYNCFDLYSTSQSMPVVEVVARPETEEEREARERAEAERRVREERSRLYAEGRTPWPTPPRAIPLVARLTLPQVLALATVTLYGLLCYVVYLVGF